MPAAITLSALALSTPDGRPLLPAFDLTFGPERTGLIGRNGVGKTTLLRALTGEQGPAAGTVTVHGRLGLLTQSIQPDQGSIADLFGAREALALLARAEHGEATAEDLAGADWTLEARIAAALASLGLDLPLETPLASLSGGQATRARLAALVLAEPDILLLDEPTNNLDREGREAVIALLAGWHGAAIVVSHDRDLLETMDAIVELTALGATRYGGNWSHYRERRALDLAAARHDLADAERRLAEIDRKAQEQAERKARKDKAGKAKGAKGDMPRILIGGRKDRSEDTGGEQSRLAEKRRGEAMDHAAAARSRIEVLQPFTVRLASTALPAGRTVVALEKAGAGYGRKPVLADLSLTVTGPERVAITGPNGAGKTTLLKLIAGEIAPLHGTLRVTPDRAVFDQKVSLLDPGETILDNFRRLNPSADANQCRAALARFMFRAEAALDRVSALSGGQVLRAGLACILGGPQPPALLILDEPTNHLEISSIEAVEAGLRAYDGALVVVSHDEAFLEAIGITRRLALIPPAG